MRNIRGRCRRRCVLPLLLAAATAVAFLPPPFPAGVASSHHRQYATRMGLGPVVSALTRSSLQKKHERRATQAAELAEQTKATVNIMRQREEKRKERRRAAEAARLEQRAASVRMRASDT